MLDYHEIVNDTVADLPVAVTWCPLCGSAVVYDRRVDGRDETFGVPASEASGDSKDSRRLSFGVSGKLADDVLVLYDRETGSEWKQSLGQAIAGPLEGAELEVLSAQVTTRERFRAAHPDGQVLARPGGKSETAGNSAAPAPIDYDEEPYDTYFESDGFGLAAHREGGSREWDRDDVDPRTVVLGVESGSEALGFPLPTIEEAGGVVTAEVGGTAVVVFATPDGIHAFQDPGSTGSRPVTGDSGRTGPRGSVRPARPGTIAASTACRRGGYSPSRGRTITERRPSTGSEQATQGDQTISIGPAVVRRAPAVFTAGRRSGHGPAWSRDRT